jgi:hypothetical protein
MSSASGLLDPVLVGGVRVQEAAKTERASAVLTARSIEIVIRLG